MSAEEWTTLTWADVEAGDFVRVRGEILRCEGVSSADTWHLFSPSRGEQSGKPHPSAKVDVRIRHNDVLTSAGQRLDGLSKEGRNALEDLLGAEQIAVQRLSGRLVNPWILPARLDAQELSSHLRMFHGLYAGDVKASDGVSLREVHKSLHSADLTSQPISARREAHIHDDAEFARLK